MEPKEEAIQLVNKFSKDARLRSSGFLVANENHSAYHSKQCALICVDRTINKLNKKQESSDREDFWFNEIEIQNEIAIKQEINKL